MNYWRLGEHSFHKEFIKYGCITMDHFSNKKNFSKSILENLTGDGVRCFKNWFQIKKGDVIFLCTKYYFFGVCIAKEDYNEKNLYTFLLSDNSKFKMPGIPVNFILPPQKSFPHTLKIKQTMPDTFSNADANGFTVKDLKILFKKADRKLYFKLFPKTFKISIKTDVKETFNKFSFTPGWHKKSHSNIFFHTKREKIKIERIHNKIQELIGQSLINIYGVDFISLENKINSKRSIDIVRKIKSKYIFYELKVYNSLRLCIREALGQLLEYAHWTGENLVEELIIVTPHSLHNDKFARNYLEYLRTNYSIKINYQRYNIEEKFLEPTFY